MRDERRKEEEEARGTRFGQEILDTDVYEQSSGSNYVNYLPGNNDEVCFYCIYVFVKIKYFEIFLG